MLKAGGLEGSKLFKKICVRFCDLAVETCDCYNGWLEGHW